jgi:hypothetical protein
MMLAAGVAFGLGVLIARTARRRRTRHAEYEGYEEPVIL